MMVSSPTMSRYFCTLCSKKLSLSNVMVDTGVPSLSLAAPFTSWHPRYKPNPDSVSGFKSSINFSIFQLPIQDRLPQTLLPWLLCHCRSVACGVCLGRPKEAKLQAVVPRRISGPWGQAGCMAIEVGPSHCFKCRGRVSRILEECDFYVLVGYFVSQQNASSHELSSTIFLG